MYRLKTTKRADKEIEAHKQSGQKILVDRIKQIFKELKLHPEIGIGKPEKLKNDPQERWSRRINEKNRITYQIDDVNLVVTVLSAIGHYDDK